MLLANNSKNDFLAPINNSFSYIKEMLAEYSDVRDFDFFIPDVIHTTRTVYQEYISILEKTSNCVKNMNDNVNSNPWRNTVLESKTENLVIRFENCKEKLSAALKNLVQLCTNLHEEYLLRFENTLNGIKDLRDFIYLSCQSPLIPLAWFDDEKIKILKDTAADLKKLQNNYFQTISDIKLAVSNLKKINPLWKFDIKNLSNSDETDKICKEIEKIIDSSSFFSILNTDPGKESIITTVEQKIKENNYLRNKILTDYSEDVFSIDARAMETRFKHDYFSFSRFVKFSYYRDKKNISRYLKDKEHHTTYIDILDLVSDIQKINDNKSEIALKKNDMLDMFPNLYAEENTDWSKIHSLVFQYKNLVNCYGNAMHLSSLIKRNLDSELYNKSLFGKRYKSFLTDWEEIQKAIDWTEKMQNKYVKFVENHSPFIKNICSDSEYIVSLKFYAENIDEILEENMKYITNFADYFEQPADIINSDIEAFEKRFEDCCTSFQLINVWSDYKKLRSRAAEMGIGGYFKIIEDNSLSSEEIVPVFEKHFLTLFDKIKMAE